MESSFDGSHRAVPSGKRRLERCRVRDDDDSYEGSWQRQRLLGGEARAPDSPCLSLSRLSASGGVRTRPWGHSGSAGPTLESAVCRPAGNADLEQSIIKGVESMDLQPNAEPLGSCPPSPFEVFGGNGNNSNSSKCYGSSSGFDVDDASSKENKSTRKLKTVRFRCRTDRDHGRKSLPPPPPPPSVADASSGRRSELSRDRHDPLAHRENVSSAGTPPDANSFASFEEVWSQVTDEVLARPSCDPRRRRDATQEEEEREDRIVRWLYAVRNVTESRGHPDVRLS